MQKSHTSSRLKSAVSTSSYTLYVDRLCFERSSQLLQEELNALVTIYERRGYFDEVLTLLEAGLSLERAHVRRFSLYLFHMPSRASDGNLHRVVNPVQQVPTREV
jgi:hypothetical protein